MVADWRRFVETSWSAQMAGLDVVAAQYGTGRFILDACGPARPVLAACRACEAGLRGRESSVLRDGRARRAGVKCRGLFPRQPKFCIALPIWDLKAP